MPLGDGLGPPEGTGPMTGRRRLADVCRGASDTKRSGGWLPVLLLLGLVALVVGIAGCWLGCEDE